MPDIKDAKRRHAGYYLKVLTLANGLYAQGEAGVKEGLAVFDREWANIQAGYFWATDNSASKLCSSCASEVASLLSIRQPAPRRLLWFTQAVEAARRLRDRRAEGSHLGNLGIAHGNIGEPRQALECHTKQLQIAREFSDRYAEATALGQVGLAHADLAELSLAIDYYEQQLRLTREIEDGHGQSTALCSLGMAYVELGETRRAIMLFEEALALDRAIGDPRNECNSLSNLGTAFSRLGDNGHAVASFEQALLIASPTGAYGSMSALTTTAVYHASTGLMTSLIDANGQTTNYTYDAVNRPATITRPNGGGSTSYNYGDTPDNLYVRTQTSLDPTRVVETIQYYDKLGRPCRSFLNEGSTFTSDPDNGDRGSLVNYYSDNTVPGGSGIHNNGNLQRQDINIPGSGFFQDNFTYDSLNRLTSISEKLNGTNDTVKQAYTFDRWGNRTIDQNNTTTNVPHPEYTVDPNNNNRLLAPAGYTHVYDAAGNQTRDTYTTDSPTAGERTYDAENRIIKAQKPVTGKVSWAYYLTTATGSGCAGRSRLTRSGTCTVSKASCWPSIRRTGLHWPWRSRRKSTATATGNCW